MADYLTEDVIKAINYAKEEYPNSNYPIYDDPKLKPLIKFRKKAGQLSRAEIEMMYGQYVKNHKIISVEDKLNFIRSAKIDGVKITKALRMVGKDRAWYQRVRDKRNHLN